MDAVSTQQNAVSTLSNDIHVITAEINAYQRVAGEAIFEIGKRLKHVKESDLAHGEWAKWCESIGMSRGQATKFITVFDELGGRNGSTSNQIGLEALYQIATMTPEQRELEHEIPSTGEVKKVEDMTVKELREVKKVLKWREAEIEDVRRSEREVKAKLKAVEIELAKKPKEIIVEKPVEKVVTIDNTDYKAVERLKAYEERFGALENYSERVRATNVADVTTSIVSFNMAVRDFIKHHAYLLKYQDTIQFIDKVTQREYNEAVQALKEISAEFCKVSGIGDYVDVEFSEVNN